MTVKMAAIAFHSGHRENRFLLLISLNNTHTLQTLYKVLNQFIVLLVSFINIGYTIHTHTQNLNIIHIYIIIISIHLFYNFYTILCKCIDELPTVTSGTDELDFK